MLSGVRPQAARFVLVTVAVLLGCARAVPLWVPEASHYEFTVDAPPDQVFEHLLRFAQTRNLNVQVLEKSSGLIRFENAALAPFLLDTYCRYPYANADTGQPWDTFSNWNMRSLQGGAGPVTGHVSLTVLTTRAGHATVVNIRGNWSGGNPAEQHILESKLVLEKEIEQGLREAIAPPSSDD